MAIFSKLSVDLANEEIAATKVMTDPIEQLFEHYKNRLLSEANLDELNKLGTYQKRKKIEMMVNIMMEQEKVVLTQQQKEKLMAMVINDSVGLGPLETLLKDDEISEIMVNSPYEVFIERSGQITLANVQFKNNEHIRHIIDRIVAPIGRRIDESSPLVDGRLQDGSRINAVIPPIALHGPVLTIRKFKKDPFTIQDLISFGSMTEEMAQFLESCIASKLNILISGGTGSGKTTLLNVASSFIPQGERVITIEDMAELKLERRNVVSLEARPKNMEGSGEVTIRHLVKNALRMRPDRIIVGEVRGEEVIDMLQAMNTGHEGSLTTIHANNPKDAMSRLEAMVIMNNPSMTTEVVRPYISSALDLVVQTNRLSDGARKVVSISELVESGNRIEIKEIFRFNRTGIDAYNNVQGKHELTGYVPTVIDKFKAYGQELSDDFFYHKQEGFDV